MRKFISAALMAAALAGSLGMASTASAQDWGSRGGYDRHWDDHRRDHWQDHRDRDWRDRDWRQYHDHRNWDRRYDDHHRWDRY